MLKTPPQKEVVDLCKLGNALLRQNQLSEAQETFERARALDGQNPYVLVGLGDTLRRLQRYEEAADSYRKVLETDPDNIFALRGLGDAYRGLQRFQEAISAWERYVQIKSQDFCVYTRLGDAHKKLNHFQEAERYYLKTLEISPGDKYAYLGLANLYYRMGREDDAIQYSDRLLALDEANFINVLTMVGNILRRRKDFTAAIGYYERALRIDPKNVYALYGIGDAYRGLQRYADAVASWKKIMEQEPENETVLTRLGDACLNLGEPEKAKAFYQRALEVSDSEYARLGMGRALRKEGRHEPAPDDHRPPAEHPPADLRVALEMAAAYAEKGDRKSVVGILQGLARQAESDFEACKRVNRLFLETLERCLLEGPEAVRRRRGRDLELPAGHGDAD